MIKRALFTSFRKLFLLIVTISLLPSLCIIILSGLEYGRSLEQSVRLEALRQVETFALVQNTITESVRQTLTTLAALPAFTDGDTEEQAVILGEVLRRNPDYINMTALDSTGRATVSPRLPVGTDLSMRKHVQEALEGTDFAAGEFILARVKEEPAFPFSISLRNREDEVIGLISTVYRLSSYASVFDRLNLPAGAILGITDHAGIRIFYHPQKETNPLGLPIKDSIWEAITAGGEAATLTDSGSDGIRRFYAFRKMCLPGQNEPYLNIVLGIPEESVLAPARRILRRNLILIALTALLSMSASAFLGYLLLESRLLMVTQTVFEIENGNLSARIHLQNAPKEIRVVANAIDTMAESLEKRNRERDEAEHELSEALKEKETLLREIHHRVKNNLQLILSMISLERGNSTSIESFAEQIENKVRAMSSVHELMYQSETLADIEIKDFLEKLAELNESSGQMLTVSVESDSSPLLLEKAISLSLISNELILNCAKYGRDQEGRAQVGVSFRISGRTGLLVVRDRGKGFPEGFSIDRDASLGLQLVNTLAAQLGGEVSIENRNIPNDPGAAVSVRFPISI
jgi:two-component sensor histidine kinase